MVDSVKLCQMGSILCILEGVFSRGERCSMQSSLLISILMLSMSMSVCLCPHDSTSRLMKAVWLPLWLMISINKCYCQKPMLNVLWLHVNIKQQLDVTSYLKNHCSKTRPNVLYFGHVSCFFTIYQLILLLLCTYADPLI